MELKRSSKLFRWGYWFVDSWRWPRRISLCWLFWRVLVIGTLCNVGIGMGVAVASPILAVVYGVSYLKKRFGKPWNEDDEWWDRYIRRQERAEKIENWFDNNVIWQAILSLKSNVCPIIEIKEK